MRQYRFESSEISPTIPLTVYLKLFRICLFISSNGIIHCCSLRMASKYSSSLIFPSHNPYRWSPHKACKTCLSELPTRGDKVFSTPSRPRIKTSDKSNIIVVYCTYQAEYFISCTSSLIHFSCKAFCSARAFINASFSFLSVPKL